MTDSDWLSRRTPRPPEELAAAIRGALTREIREGETPTPAELLAAAQGLLSKVVRNECAKRESALDLLTADALVTYALEIANENPGALKTFPELAIARLAGRTE